MFECNEKTFFLAHEITKSTLSTMVDLQEIRKFCDHRVSAEDIKDFPGAWNGLQIENSGTVSKIGASVDAGLIPYSVAIDKNIDFLVCHHGMFWNPPIPLTGTNFNKIKLCIDSNLAVYSSHLPLDCHPEIGNNAILANKLELKACGTFLPYEGVDIGLLATASYSRNELCLRLNDLFNAGYHRIEYGVPNPEKIAILTGSGQSAVQKILEQGTDTLITGELKQHHFNLAQEMKLNLYACGHYATERFGVSALAQEISQKFDLPYEFVETSCTL
jgi:dinuclear metal center YbgI/SA1388 family protein